MYAALASLPGITYVSVGHRPSLLLFHSTRLRLFGMEASPSFTLENIGSDEISERGDADSAFHAA